MNLRAFWLLSSKLKYGIRISSSSIEEIMKAAVHHLSLLHTLGDGEVFLSRMDRCHGLRDRYVERGLAV